MALTEQQIVELVEKLSASECDSDLIWPISYTLVREVIESKRLPARTYAPISSFGGSDWTENDFTALADEWITSIRGDRAKRILASREPSHICNAIRKSIYHQVLGQAKKGPETDIVDSLREVLPEFPSIKTDNKYCEWKLPSVPFPRQTRERSERQRAVTNVEMRAALCIIEAQEPIHWSKNALIECIKKWAEVEETHEHSLNTSGGINPPEKNLADAVSKAIGIESAHKFLDQLSEVEKKIFFGLIMSQEGLEKAARKLGTPKSTLDDRAKKLTKKLCEIDDVKTMDPLVFQAFLDEIRRVTPGIFVSDRSTKGVE